MSKVTAVKEAVKESLIGSEEQVQLSSQTKSRFISKAAKDQETGELYMGPEEFIDAVAPQDEDFVSESPTFAFFTLKANWLTRGRVFFLYNIAQDQEGTILDSLPRCRSSRPGPDLLVGLGILRKHIDETRCGV